MKKLFFYLFVFVFFLSISNSIYSQGYLKGKIVEVENGDNATITVKGYANENIWIGCTVNPDTYNEHDLKPQQILKGTIFEIKFNLSSGIIAIDNIMSGKTPYVVALWENKISLRECEKKYGKGSDECKWARKNGYQFENRIDRYTGSYTP